MFQGGGGPRWHRGLQRDTGLSGPPGLCTWPAGSALLHTQRPGLHAGKAQRGGRQASGTGEAQGQDSARRVSVTMSPLPPPGLTGRVCGPSIRV